MSTASGRLKLSEQQLVQTTHKGIGILQGTLFGQESFFVNEFGPLGKGGVIARLSGLLNQSVLRVDFQNEFFFPTLETQIEKKASTDRQ